MRTWKGFCLLAVVMVAFAPSCFAQSTVTPEDEYKKLIRVSEDIQPLGATPFGEQVSLYNGSLSFEQTDISLAGTGPLLQLTRSVHTMETHPDDPSGGLEGFDGGFSDWDIEIPRITTNVGYHVRQTDWVVVGAASHARCSRFGVPPTVAGYQGNADWEPHSWWSGVQLVIPGQGSQDLLARGPSNTLAPNGTPAAFPIVTTKHWMISCDVLTDDESNGGEGFIALAPDGTKYTLNHLVYRWAPTLDRAVGTSPNIVQGAQSNAVHPSLATSDLLQRKNAEMMVTKVEDRFGNTLKYTYDPNNAGSLTSISASDGRQLTLAHEDGTGRITKATLIDAVSATQRVWQYVYDPAANGFHQLKEVILPDQTKWKFSLGIEFVNMTPVTPANTCDDTPEFLRGQKWTSTITHPSGLVGTFIIAPLVRGRSYVFKECQVTGPGASFATRPRVYALPAIASKTFSGAGMPGGGQTWRYEYSSPNASWSSDPCATTNSCANTIWTDVVNPELQDTRYTFSNRYDYSESQLLQTDFHSGVDELSPVLRSEANSYAVLPLLGVGIGVCPTPSAWPWPWPCDYGDNLQTRINSAQTQNISPTVKRTITQDADVSNPNGDTYTWQADSFDPYAQVMQTQRFNSISSQNQSTITEATTYRNDTDVWVLGLPLEVTNVTTGEAESSNTYTLKNPTLLTRSRFGQLLMTYAFNGAGQLASFTDGNSNTTKLGNYKRGIPQAIDYPDSTNEALTVDDFGQISSVTDQLRHVTVYNYDPIGRIAGITYPAGDEVAWAPTTFTYEPVDNSERGLAGTHWKRTTSTGGATTVTYFDALLRPVLSDTGFGVGNNFTLQTSTAVTYDSKGQTRFTSYPMGTAQTFSDAPTASGTRSSYDTLGRVTQVQQNSDNGTLLTSSTAYLSGARQQFTDPNTNVTTTSYQVFDEPSSSAVIRVQAPEGILQTITRDVYGNPHSIAQSGLSGPESEPVFKTLFYDSSYRLCRTSEPETGDEVMAYDAANNLAWSVAGAERAEECALDQVTQASHTTRTYDAMNRLKTIAPPNGTQSTTYGYDAVGRLTCAVTNGTCSPDPVTGSAIWRGTYNFRGMLTGESMQVGGQIPWGIGYAHDVNGSVSLIHYPDGENVSYAPDALGRPTQAGSYANNVTYFPNGQMSQFVFGNGAAYTSELNVRQGLASFSYGTSSAPQLSEDLSYDANGNITGVLDGLSGPRTKSFVYDGSNRLIHAVGSWGIQAYTYDVLNNIRTLQSDGQMSTYNYDPSHKLASITRGDATIASYIYDNRGNVMGNNGAMLVFDLKNQLTHIGSSDAYDYDAAGRRVSKIVNGVYTYYFYSQGGKLMYQWEPSLSKSTDFIYLGGKMIADNETVGQVSLAPESPATMTVPPLVLLPATALTGSATLSWSASASATTYVVEKSADNGTSWLQIYNGSGTTKIVSGLRAGTYKFRVEACNTHGCSAWTAGNATLVVAHFDTGPQPPPIDDPYVPPVISANV